MARPRIVYNQNNTEGKYPTAYEFRDTELRKGSKIVATDLVDLYDVDANSPEDGQILKYNESDQKWHPGEPITKGCDILDDRTYVIADDLSTKKGFHTFYDALEWLYTCKWIKYNNTVIFKFEKDDVIPTVKYDYAEGSNVFFDGNGHILSLENKIRIYYEVYDQSPSTTKIKYNPYLSTGLDQIFTIGPNTRFKMKNFVIDIEIEWIKDTTYNLNHPNLEDLFYTPFVLTERSIMEANDISFNHTPLLNDFSSFPHDLFYAVKVTKDSIIKGEAGLPEIYCVDGGKLKSSPDPYTYINHYIKNSDVYTAVPSAFNNSIIINSNIHKINL